jgi:hypothetical protein
MSVESIKDNSPIRNPILNSADWPSLPPPQAGGIDYLPAIDSRITKNLPYKRAKQNSWSGIERHRMEMEKDKRDERRKVGAHGIGHTCLQTSFSSGML